MKNVKPQIKAEIKEAESIAAALATELSVNSISPYELECLRRKAEELLATLKNAQAKLWVGR